MSSFFALPFIFLLLSVALGPLLCPLTWNRYSTKIILSLSGIVILLYFFTLKDYITPFLSIVEYLDFILLIVSLYIISGGICIEMHVKTSPMINCFVLLSGAIISNFIGTTGAAALLIRPFMQINKKRLQIYHIVFFIFIVCNVGGCLSVIGDPPIFIAFLKGMPFLWPLKNNFLPWLFTISCLLIIFFYLDYNNTKESAEVSKNKRLITIEGKRNFIWIILATCAIFVNPLMIKSLPMLDLHGHKISFIREILLMIICILSYRFADKKALEKNEYSWDPIIELAILFFGIFVTMAPAIGVIENLIQHIDKKFITSTSLYWFTAFFSSFLDNTPTLLNALAISMSLEGADISKTIDVYNYANGLYPNSITFFKAICLTSVFFGGFTYIGNGPNFMIKSIAEKRGIKMPTFFGYIVKYSLKFLFPVLFCVWFLFCR